MKELLFVSILFTALTAWAWSETYEKSGDKIKVTTEVSQEYEMNQLVVLKGNTGS